MENLIGIIELQWKVNGKIQLKNKNRKNYLLKFYRSAEEEDIIPPNPIE